MPNNYAISAGASSAAPPADVDYRERICTHCLTLDEAADLGQVHDATTGVDIVIRATMPPAMGSFVADKSMVGKFASTRQGARPGTRTT